MRSTLLARQLVSAGDEQDDSYYEEELALQLLEDVRNQPPFFDQVRRVPDRRSPEVRRTWQEAAEVRRVTSHLRMAAFSLMQNIEWNSTLG